LAADRQPGRGRREDPRNRRDLRGRAERDLSRAEKRRVNLTAIALKAEQEESQKNHRETLQRIRDTKDRDYRMTEFLQTQVIKVISEAQKAGRPVGSELDSVKALKIAMDAIKGGTANKWVLLGLDKAQEDPDAHLP